MTTLVSFPQFSELPRELRDMIWNYALHPDPDFSGTVRTAYHIRLRSSPPCATTHLTSPLEAGNGRNPMLSYTYMICPSPPLTWTTQASRNLVFTCHESRQLVVRELPDVVRFPAPHSYTGTRGRNNDVQPLSSSTSPPSPGPSFRFNHQHDELVLIVPDSEALYEFRATTLHRFPSSPSQRSQYLNQMGLPFVPTPFSFSSGFRSRSSSSSSSPSSPSSSSSRKTTQSQTIPRIGVLYETTLISVIGNQLHIPPKLQSLIHHDMSIPNSTPSPPNPNQIHSNYTTTHRSAYNPYHSHSHNHNRNVPSPTAPESRQPRPITTLPVHWRQLSLRSCRENCEKRREIELFEEALEKWCAFWMIALQGAMEDYDLNLGQDFVGLGGDKENGDDYEEDLYEDGYDYGHRELRSMLRFQCPGCGEVGWAERFTGEAVAVGA
ncbi:hypothetical protein MKZ38_005073 [Zalerion maritima]|uniref:2EXR domain-containing protein n=1 Tax=Zalerion maritima TaxID=339359 RepID=A0AAD5RLT1_9PEZI|nr:hypothetical protein MKZ38_005073 [Zalerion maritima]